MMDLVRKAPSTLSRELLKIGPAGIASAEVIQRQRNADVLQLPRKIEHEYEYGK
jgi:hypothetical protein